MPSEATPAQAEAARAREARLRAIAAQAGGEIVTTLPPVATPEQAVLLPEQVFNWNDPYEEGYWL